MSMAQVLRLKPAFTDAQAEALAGLFDEEAATKADLEKVRLELGADIQRLRLELGAQVKMGDDGLKAEIERFRVEVQRDLKATEARLVAWVVGQGAATISVLFALLHFFGK